MKDEKLTFNYIVFAVLALGIIFGYSKLFPPRPQAEQAAVEKTEKRTERKQAATAAVPAGVWGEQNPWDSVQTGKTLEIRTPLYTAFVDTAGGTVKKFLLHNYFENPGAETRLNLLEVSSTAPETALSVEKIKLAPAIPFKYEGAEVVNVEGLAREIALLYEKDGVKITKKLSFAPDTYVIGGRYEIENKSGETAEYAIHFLQRGEIEEARYGPADALVVSLNGEKKQFNDAGDKSGRSLSGRVDWLGFSKKYFILASLPESGETTEVRAKNDKAENIETAFSYGRFSVPAGAISVRKWKSYIGPKEESMLKAAGYGFENAIDYGWFGGLSKLAVKILNYTNRIFNNYGVSIIVITIVFRLMFLPLSIRGMRSMKKMQKKMEIIKPKIDALKEKFKDDKKRQNEEMMKLYSSHGVNPLSSLGGCLPMLAQVPVFIALYYGLLYSIDLRHSDFLWITDLSAPEKGLFTIPWTSVPFRILPLAMGVSWWFSTKLTPMTATGDTAAMQAKIMQFMPVVFTVVMWDFPSGLVLYWTASNVLSVAQQIYINRSSPA